MEGGNPIASAASVVRMIRDNGIFRELDDAALLPLVSAGSLVDAAAGDTLVRQDEIGDAMFLVLEGVADITVETSYGPVQLATLQGGHLFGEIGAFTGLPRTATVCARTDVRSLRIGRDAVVALGRDHPDLFLGVIGLLGQRLATINRALGVYTHALAALDQANFNPAILDDLTKPVPELLNFARAFKRMAEQIVERRAHRQEMASAAAIQRAMLPGAPPAALTGRVDLYAAMRPAKEVGGDLFDYFLLDDDRLAFAVGDVSGKGVPAALFMAISRTVLRLVLREGATLAEAMTRANDLLGAENEQSMFVTMFCATLDLVRGDLTYCNCGHNPPALIRPGGSIEELKLTGPPLAAMPGIAYRTRSLTLAPDDLLFLYTDGVTEATAADEQLFGETRLHAVLSGLGSCAAKDMVARIVGAVDDFVAGAPQFDDITTLAFRYRPSSMTIPS